MKGISKTGAYAKRHSRRFERTLAFVDALGMKGARILDLGPNNPLSELLRESGYSVTNTEQGQDLDLNFDIVKREEFDLVTGFEILEHMVSPFPMLRSIAADKLVLSVPLKLWFSNAYWNEADPYDRHFHEFESRQLKMLLEKSGWRVVKEAKYTAPGFNIGFRAILRLLTPRHYFVYCQRV